MQFSAAEEAAELLRIYSSDLYAPAAGTVVAVNPALESAPETVNSAPYEGGWIMKLKLANSTDAAALLDPAAYSQHIG